jgi:AcrR family transcriptional regulator
MPVVDPAMVTRFRAIPSTGDPSGSTRQPRLGVAARVAEGNTLAWAAVARVPSRLLRRPRDSVRRKVHTVAPRRRRTKVTEVAVSTDPLFEALFRPTSMPPAIASAAPVRASGTRSRAGNAMNRTRAALLDGARRAVEASGTKITMAQVAAAAGVAKATLYNHFRTREAVLSALLVDEVRSLVERHASEPLPSALAGAAGDLSAHRLLRTLSLLEPATLVALARVDCARPAWQSGREAVREVLTAAGHDGADLVLRWLASFIVNPARPEAIAADLEILLAALPTARPATQSAQAC